MITIYFNDDAITIPNNQSLIEFLIGKGYIDPCFAISLNHQFIPRIGYANVLLKENDVVDIITAMQGG